MCRYTSIQLNAQMVHLFGISKALLANEGVKSRCFHKDIPQPVREMALQKFKYERRLSVRQQTKQLHTREGSAPILICTDLAARGIDFSEVEHVIQLEFAASTIDHLHRVGRTARAGAPGLGKHVTRRIEKYIE